MANAITGNKIYISATGLITDKRTLVTQIIFTPDAANDQLILKETQDGEPCISFRAATAKNTVQFDFSHSPLLFNNGIYVSTLTANATATLVTTQAG